MITKMIVLMLDGNVCNINFLILQHKKMRERKVEEQRELERCDIQKERRNDED